MVDLKTIFAGEPAFRVRQVYSAWFDPNINGYGEITTLSKSLRERVAGLPWLGVKLKEIQEDKDDKTRKALLELEDGACVETVLMGRVNKKLAGENESLDDRYTVCLSTQVGCAMNCAFCSTGKLGFKRNLSAREIVDQYRFWLCHSRESGNPAPLNVVLMGQGEPLLNYDAVKEALNIFIKYAKLGPSKITLSTAGVVAGMEKILTDDEFPPVRVVISLHSALEKTRARLMPSHQKGFCEFLPDWARRYHEKFSSRAHFVGLEYAMLGGINDDEKHLRALIKLASRLGRVRVNLIPYNTGLRTEFASSADEVIQKWRADLMAAGLTVTVRRSQGQNIAAACGQLAGKA